MSKASRERNRAQELVRQQDNGYYTTRGERLEALRERLAWLDSKLLSLAGTTGGGMVFMQREREATHWAIDTLSALVECHSLKYAIDREKRLEAERQQDDAVRESTRR